MVVWCRITDELQIEFFFIATSSCGKRVGDTRVGLKKKKEQDASARTLPAWMRE